MTSTPTRPSHRNRAHRSRFLAAVSAIGLAAALALTACSSASPGGGGSDAPGKGELTIASQSDPGTLDPALINQAAQWFTDLAYAPLIQTSSDGTIRSSLATEWGYVGEGNTVFELTLRPNVTFADGGQLTAQGVVDHLVYVKGAGGQLGDSIATFEKIEATGPLTVRVTLSQPNPELVYLFAQSGVGVTQIISPEGLANTAKLGSETHGAGPYVLDASATITGDTYVYQPNPNYWDPDNIHWDKVTIKVIPNINSVLNALRSGQADFAQGDFTTAQAAQEAGLTTHFVPQVFQGIALNDRDGQMVPALGDIRVRQAINYALDRETIATALLGATGRPTTQTVNGVGYVPALDDYYAYDPDKARSLLAEAGYADGLDLPTLSTPFASGDLVTQAIAGQLAEVGINLVVESKADVNEFFNLMATGAYPVAWIGFGSMPMYLEGINLFGPGALFNPFRTQDDQITELYDQLAKAPADQVEALSQQIETRLVELAWFAPVAWVPLGQYATAKIDPVAVTTTSGASPLVAIIDLKPAGS
ncbi:MAG: ABC transporter substrate-binding protein [Propionibacteriaceae bacterium]|jgi:peptide/nickel transport system substrate-binding protein|nr:ABC transporter substrate-binding protein [Propionibacteriaceae bacterium]